jgi:3-oxoacyl-[acyl-carrier protein] reductase
MLLQNKNVVVTGASRGLGRVIAQTLWREGASLLLVARSFKALEAAADELDAARVNETQALSILDADLETDEAVAQVVEAAQNAFPALHGLVNNAGILGPIGPAWENDWAHWQRTLRVNLLAPVALCRDVTPWMARTGGGAIVNLSGGGATSPRANFSAYATAKTGLVRFTETLAVEAREFGVRVNALAPGAMPTDMLQEVLHAGPESIGAAEYRKAQEQAQAGAGVAEKAAAACAFLLSDRAKDITGRLISAQWDNWEKLDSLSGELAATDIYTLRRIVPEDRGKKW